MKNEIRLSELKLDEKTWPMSKRIEESAKRGWQYYGMVMKEVYNKFGQEAVECFDAQMTKAAEMYVTKALKNFNIKGNDARTVAAYFILADSIVFPNIKFDVIEESPKKVILRAGPPCPLTKDPAKDLPAEVCIGAMGHERTACRIINPKLKFSAPKLMSAGDEYCELIFELEN